MEFRLLAMPVLTSGAAGLPQARKWLENLEKHGVESRVYRALPGARAYTEFLEFSEYRDYTCGLFYKFKLKH